MKKIAAILLLPLIMPGCAVPSALSLAGYAVESASYMKTGKTVSDHAVSAVAGRDCQLLHGVTKGQICKGVKRSKRLAGKVSDDRSAEAPGRQTKSKARQIGIHRSKTPADKWVVIVGIFPDLFIAKKSAAAVAPEKTMIVTAVVDGDVVYKVTSLPFGIADAENKKGTFVRPDNPHVSLVQVCPAWMQDDRCIVIY
jgi:hypothetical protein